MKQAKMLPNNFLVENVCPHRQGWDLHTVYTEGEHTCQITIHHDVHYPALNSWAKVEVWSQTDLEWHTVATMHPALWAHETGRDPEMEDYDHGTLGLWIAHNGLMGRARAVVRP